MYVNLSHHEGVWPDHVFAMEFSAFHKYITSSLVCVYVCCRHGNDSQKAVLLLKEMLTKEETIFKLQDIIGGLTAWAEVVDPTFPKY